MLAPSSLFRQEAMEFQQHTRQWGSTAKLQPLSTKILTWFIAAAIALIVAFLFFTQYARKETVIGYLKPVSGTAKIFTPQQGTIKEIYVKEGQLVQAGQDLLTVETSQISTNGEDVNSSMLATLGSQQRSLRDQISAEQRRMQSEQARLAQSIDGLEREIGEINAQITTQTEQIRLANELVNSVTGLRAKGFISELEYKQRELGALEQKQKLNSLKQQLAARQNQLVEAQFSLKQLPTVTGGKLQNLRNQLAATEQRIAELTGKRAYVVRAPTTGRISTLQASLGEFADPRRAQMEIVPQDSVLQAELFAPARAIGFVQAGQKVRILYDAFPYQEFGTYGGRVSFVSQTMLTKSDRSGPVELKEPAYRVSVALDRPDIDAYGKRVPLQADMLLRADIILEKRSLINWLLRPLLQVRM